MDWIKRNLFFVIGAIVALVLLVGAGFYTWTGWSHNAKALEDINAKYEELKRLTNLNPNPGSGKLDNVKTAKEQQKTLQDLIARVAKQLEAIPSIPAEAQPTNITAEAFAQGLSTTIHRLQNEATNAGVILTPRYNFSFEQQSQAVKFAPGSVGPLAIQLGEVKVIADVLIAAKINSLDSLQRERVSADDASGPATDYLDQHSETNELAILTPYQITFRCFTPELALVVEGLAKSPHGILLKSLNVEPGLATVTDIAALPTPAVYVQPAQPTLTPPANPYGRRGAEEASNAFNERYGRRSPVPQVQPQPVPGVVVPAAPTGPRTVLNERQLKVTMLVQVVKLLPKK